MFTSRLQGLQIPKYIPPCKVRTILESLDDEDKKILKEALDNPAWKAATLSDSLASRGIALDGKLITKHRKDACSCKVANA